MAVPKLSGPVGHKTRIAKPEKNDKFKEVGNKPADVEFVQLMLVANGFRKLGQEALRKDVALRKEVEAIVARRMEIEAKALEGAK